MYQTTILKLSKKGDHRGSLVSLESGRNIPFEVKRVYYIFDNINGIRRGFHAHRNLKQVAIVLHGSCKFLLDDGSSKSIVELNSPEQGLLIEGHVWREMFDFSPGCVLLVLADQLYDESDYIRDYDEFLNFVKEGARG